MPSSTRRNGAAYRGGREAWGHKSYASKACYSEHNNKHRRSFDDYGFGARRFSYHTEHASARSLKPLCTKTRMCAFFEQGACQRGAACSFAHGSEQLRSAPDLTRTRMCAKMLHEGWCDRGDECKFAHSECELRGQRESRALDNLADPFSLDVERTSTSLRLDDLLAEQSANHTPMQTSIQTPTGSPAVRQKASPDMSPQMPPTVSSAWPAQTPLQDSYTSEHPPKPNHVYSPTFAPWCELLPPDAGMSFATITDSPGLLGIPLADVVTPPSPGSAPLVVLSEATQFLPIGEINHMYGSMPHNFGFAVELDFFKDQVMPTATRTFDGDLPPFTSIFGEEKSVACSNESTDVDSAHEENSSCGSDHMPQIGFIPCAGVELSSTPGEPPAPVEKEVTIIIKNTFIEIQSARAKPNGSLARARSAHT